MRQPVRASSTQSSQTLSVRVGGDDPSSNRGRHRPGQLAALTDLRIKASPEQLREALHRRVTDHHRFLLHLQYIDFADAAHKKLGGLVGLGRTRNLGFDAKLTPLAQAA